MTFPWKIQKFAYLKKPLDTRAFAAAKKLFHKILFQILRFCLAGEKDFKTLFVPLEKAKCQFESVWNSTNLVSYAV